MASRKQSRKQTRKQQIAEDTADDPFLDKANAMAAWTEKNLRSLMLGTLGIVVVVAGVGAGGVPSLPPLCCLGRAPRPDSGI